MCKQEHKEVYITYIPQNYHSILTTDLIVHWIELPYLSKLKPAFTMQIYFRSPNATKSTWRSMRILDFEAEILQLLPNEER